MRVQELDIFFMVLFPAVILMHLSNNVLIIINKKLHKTAYLILINLSFSDVLLLITVLLMNSYTRYHTYCEVAHTVFYTVSVLSTFCITIDRYIAVQYCLRYREIVTRKRLLGVLLLLWISSVVLALIPLLVSIKRRRLYKDCIHVTIYLLCSVILILSSLWIRRIRNTHLACIRKTNAYFGIEDARLSVLRNLATAVLEVIKLNFVTAILVVLSNIIDVITFYYFQMQNLPFVIISIVTKTLYILSNPIVYMLTMTDLKRQYCKMIHFRSVRPVNFTNASRQSSIYTIDSQP